MGSHYCAIDRDASISMLADLAMSLVKQNTGGSVWESNPLKTLLMPPDGVEVREAHRDSNAPSSCRQAEYTLLA